MMMIQEINLVNSERLIFLAYVSINSQHTPPFAIVVNFELPNRMSKFIFEPFPPKFTLTIIIVNLRGKIKVLFISCQETSSLVLRKRFWGNLSS